MPTIDADPYPWPYNGDWRPENTAVIVIDMQTDFCGKGGYVDTMGYDLVADPRADRADRRPARRDARQGLSHHPHARGPSARSRRPAAPTSAGARSASAPASATPAPAGASWCAASRAGRSSPNSRREPGEPIIDKPGKGSFCATDLELILRTRGIDNLVLTGITTDVCVHTTMREANDRGFECLLLEDCCARDRPRQPSRRDQDGQDAGRRVRRGRDSRRPSSRACRDAPGLRPSPRRRARPTMSRRSRRRSLPGAIKPRGDRRDPRQDRGQWLRQRFHARLRQPRAEGRC